MIFNLIKNLFFITCKLLGVFYWYRHKQNRSVIVLTYHGVVSAIPQGLNGFEFRNCVTQDQFEKHIKLLLRYYKPVDIDKVIENDFNVFDRGFVITFDDGFRNNCTLALPILAKYGIQGCFFITTGLIGTNEMLWTEKITYLLFHTEKKDVTLELDQCYTLQLNSFKSREKASWLIRDYLKMSNRKRITSVIRQLEQQLNDVKTNNKNLNQERYKFMNWDNVRKLSNESQVIGSHTHLHEVLSTLNFEQCKAEIEKSRSVLKEKIGITCKYFSYPNGTRRDFHEEHKKLLVDTGYKAAFSQIPGKNIPYSDPFELKRFNVANMNLIAFEATVCGFRDILKQKNEFRH